MQWFLVYDGFNEICDCSGIIGVECCRIGSAVSSILKLVSALNLVLLNSALLIRILPRSIGSNKLIFPNTLVVILNELSD